jgi:hypothetical protein
MKYTILSPRIGTPGDTYEPVNGVNVDELVAGGFIQQSTVKAPKGAKTKTDTNEE